MSQSSDPFDGIDWADLHRRLLVVAVRLSMVMSGDKVLEGTGFSAEDLVNDTIFKALGGDGIRYQAEKGQLFGLLKTAMERDFLDLRKKRSHQRSAHIDLTGDAAERDTRLRDSGEGERREAAALLRDVKRLVAADPQLVEYVEAVDIGCQTPAEIADVCQVPVAEIYSRRRRLKAKFASYFKGGVAK